MEKLQIDYIPISELIPYSKNPRKNDRAVDIVAKSIKEFGFKNPIILDKKNEIIAGHTRLKAAKQLGLTEVPVIWVEDLTEEQIKAFRIMDNKSHEFATWDYDILKGEINELKDFGVPIENIGFNQEEVNFFNLNESGATNDSYQEWRKSGGLDYENNNENGIQTIVLHFKTVQDVENFSKLINQNITPRTKYLWFPKQPEDKVVGLQYEDTS